MNPTLGQEAALRVLNQALAGGRMHHAWLFHGPKGVGKFTTALHVAQCLLCHDRSTADNGDVQPCGRCPSCGQFERDDEEHPDLHVIRKEQAAQSSITALRNRKLTNIPIDLIREHMTGGWCGSGESRKYFEPIIARKPLLGHNKVFLIDEAELMAHGANATQNAMLKFIEEPPDDTYIILVTDQADRLLPTIRSRCQRVAFGALSEAVMLERFTSLHRRVEADLAGQIDALQNKSRLSKDDRARLESMQQHQNELNNLGEVQRAAVLRFAHGSAGLAELAMRYQLYRWVEVLEPMVDALGAGRADARMGAKLGELAERFAEQWVQANDGVSKDSANKAAVRYLLALLGEFCRARLVAHAKTAPSDDADAVEKTLLPWLRGVDLLRRAEEQLTANVAAALLLDNLAVQWTVHNQ